jgi:hypothetical protein
MAENQRLPLEQTTEFKAAVAIEAQKAVAGLREQLLADLKASMPVPAAIDPMNGAMAMMQSLAMEISQLTDQGSGRRRVAPEIMRQRTQARERMFELIAQARENRAEAQLRGDMQQAAIWLPMYRLRGKVQFDEQMIDPAWIDRNHVAQATEIGWPDVPNDALVPLNGVAKDIHTAFLDSIGSVELRDIVPQQPLKVTKGGLVVKGQPSRAQRETTLEQVEGHIAAASVVVAHKAEPGRLKDVHVLGTIAKPAQTSL